MQKNILEIKKSDNGYGSSKPTQIRCLGISNNFVDVFLVILTHIFEKQNEGCLRSEERRVGKECV